MSRGGGYNIANFLKDTLRKKIKTLRLFFYEKLTKGIVYFRNI